MIIGLAGYARAGKDTLGDALVEHAGFTKFAFADKLRELVEAIDPWVLSYPPTQTPVVGKTLASGPVTAHRYSHLIDLYGYERAKAEYPEVREWLQVIGAHVRNVLGKDVWVDALFNSPEFQAAERRVITDVRYPNEAAAIAADGGIVLRVVRSGVGPANDHESEHALDEYDFDGYYFNDLPLPIPDRHVERIIDLCGYER